MQKEQMQGEVERFIHPKGYGFIRAGGDIALFFTGKGKNGTNRAVEVIPL